MVLQIFFGSKPTNAGKNPAEFLQILAKILLSFFKPLSGGLMLKIISGKGSY